MSALDDLIDSVNFDYGTGNDFYTEQEIEKARGELEAIRAELADIKGSYERVISESCPTDEQHCACVPALRAENKRMIKEWKFDKEFSDGLIESITKEADQLSVELEALRAHSAALAEALDAVLKDTEYLCKHAKFSPDEFKSVRDARAALEQSAPGHLELVRVYDEDEVTETAPGEYEVKDTLEQEKKP